MDPSAVTLQNNAKGEENTGKWENQPCWGTGATSWPDVHPEWRGLGEKDSFLCPIITAQAGLLSFSGVCPPGEGEFSCLCS